MRQTADFSSSLTIFPFRELSKNLGLLNWNRTLIDIHEDKQQAETWMASEPEMTWQAIDELIDFAIHGIKTCEGFCGSREMLGEDACFCIRARFPSNEHYFLYLELRKLAKDLTTFALIAKTSQEADAHKKEPL